MSRRDMVDRGQRYYGRYRALVVDVSDPDKLGRVKARCPRLAGDLVLDWARPKLLGPVFKNGAQQQGAFDPPVVGASVWVEFEDGDVQRPLYDGGWAAVPAGNSELPDEALGKSSASNQGKGTDTFTTPSGGPRTEPSGPFAAQYGKNAVRRWPVGHVLEVDSTPGAERLHLWHKSGAFIEFHPDGKVVFKIKNRLYQIVDGSMDEHVTGDRHTKVGGTWHFDGILIVGTALPRSVARVDDMVLVTYGDSAGIHRIIGPGSQKLRA